MQIFKYDKNKVFNICKRLLLTSSIGISSILGYKNLNLFRGRVYTLRTPFDRIIPFNRFFVIPYIIWYVYVIITLFYFSICAPRRFYRLLLGINTGMIICYIIYFFYPTMVVRPTILGDDLLGELVKLIYMRDKPYNCFPSIHVFDSVLVAMYINREEKLGRTIKYISTSIAISIIASTLFIKQHYVYDVVAGCLLAYGMYFVYNFKEVTSKYYVLTREKYGDTIERTIKL